MKSLLIFAILVLGLLSPLNALEAPLIWTDKTEYLPDSDVYIYGANFDLPQVLIKVIRPDETVDSWLVNVEQYGFSTVYVLNGIEGLYRVEASDPLSGTVLAETTFTDGPPKKYGIPPISVTSSFSTSTPTLDGILAPAGTPFPFTTPHEWDDATVGGLFSFASGASEPPWTTLKNEMFFPKKDEWARLTISASGLAPSTPPWAPAWLFIQNDGSDLYLAVEINPANKLCFECPDGTGPSDKVIFFFDTNLDARWDRKFIWAFGKSGNSPEIVAIPCSTPYPSGDCTSPTVYEAKIPLTTLLGSPFTLPSTVGFWVDSHASPHGGTTPPPPPPPGSVPEFDSSIVGLLGTASIVGVRLLQRRGRYGR